MKLSIAWIFDHIDAQWSDCDLSRLVTLFNQRTAEIESFYTITTDVTSLYAGRVVAIQEEGVSCFIPELDQTVLLPARSAVIVDQWFIVKRSHHDWQWATGKDFGATHTIELPAVYMSQQLASGLWKQQIELQDFIIEVDNKSITHRPDLWSHRGFAREVAILLELPLKDQDSLLATDLLFSNYAQESVSDTSFPYTVRVDNLTLIDRFAMAYFNHIENRASLINMVTRLCRVEAKPINAIVDLTNYVMFDIGQPLHAFDAKRITTHTIDVRLARADEQLLLLDNDTISLTDKDIVVSDGKKPLALAGIMGGKESAVASDTNATLLESAHFDPSVVRLSAARYKKRTESSARFEKMLDPHQNLIAIKRFTYLLHQANIPYTIASAVSIGSVVQPKKICIEHCYIEQRLGVTISSQEVIAQLQALGCTVELENTSEVIYHVLVPTVRCTKDVTVKEDLLEEIGRLYGYTNIPFVLPYKQTTASMHEILYRQRHVKRLLSFGFQMHEVKNYAFYHTSLLQTLNWQPTNAITIQSPVSLEYQQLVTSLIPALLADVAKNNSTNDTIRLFEIGRVWSYVQEKIVEREQIAAVLYTKKCAVSFYEIKGYVQQLFTMLKLSVDWIQEIDPEDPWFTPYQTARMYVHGRHVGTVGVINQHFVKELFVGHAAAFTLDANFIHEHKDVIDRFAPFSKYPAVSRDISMMIPVDLTVKTITKLIESCTPLIIQVRLIDFFTKNEWKDQRSVAFRYILQDDHKTLTHSEIDAVHQSVVEKLIAVGAVIR